MAPEDTPQPAQAVTGPQRIGKLLEEMERGGLDGYLVTHIPNVRYLSGFSGSSALLLVSAGGSIFVTDFRYKEQAADEVHQAEVRVAPGAYRDALAEAVQEAGLRRIGFEAPHLKVKELQELQEALGDGVDLVSNEDRVGTLRRLKDPGEVEAIQRAVDLASSVFDSILPELRPGVREREIAAEIEYRMRREGADAASFSTIVASGWRSALPHGLASDKELAAGEFVTVDMGARIDGYCSDMTRTVCLGEPTVDGRRIYEVVRQAQESCALGLREGMTGREADRLAREPIEQAGFGDYFGHGTGHGVGLEVHEGPRLSPRSEEEDRLAVGSVVTVEPGIYLPGLGGVRIEDIVALEEGGPRILTPSPKELICL
jgi:Xaa-Pro aminopeptidase